MLHFIFMTFTKTVDNPIYLNNQQKFNIEVLQF